MVSQEAVRTERAQLRLFGSPSKVKKKIYSHVILIYFMPVPRQRKKSKALVTLTGNFYASS